MIVFAGWRPFTLGIVVLLTFNLIGLWYVSLLPFTILMLDTRARIMDARSYIKTQCPTLKAKMQMSWCGRGALSYVDETYHDPMPLWIFPVGFPLVFFTRRFWKSVLGV